MLAFGVPVDIRDDVEAGVVRGFGRVVQRGDLVGGALSGGSRGIPQGRPPAIYEGKKKPARGRRTRGAFACAALGLRTSNHRIGLALITFETNDDHLPLSVCAFVLFYVKVPRTYCEGRFRARS